MVQHTSSADALYHRTGILLDLALRGGAWDIALRDFGHERHDIG